MPPHDPLFKSLLRTFFAGFLRLVAPELASRVDLAAAVFLDKEFVSTAPPRTPWARGSAGPGSSGRDRSISPGSHRDRSPRPARDGTRLRDYQRAIQGRHEDPVLSIVVYLKGGQGGICEQGLDGDLTAPGLTSFRYLSFGLSRCSAAEYLARPEPLAWALAALMERGEWSRAELKQACLSRISKSSLGPGERFELANCVETYVQLMPEDVEEFSLLGTSEIRRARTMLYRVTWADKMMGEGARQMLFSLLEDRFGSVPEEVRDRLQRIRSLERLNRLAKRVRKVASLQDLGLG